MFFASGESRILSGNDFVPSRRRNQQGIVANDILGRRDG